MGSAVRPVRDRLGDLEATLGLSPGSRGASDDVLRTIEHDLEAPRATVTAGPITPVGVSGDEIARVTAPTPRTRGTGADIGASALRGLAESGYGTAQGIANLADRLPFIDRAGEIVRGSREQMREFYGDPETGAGKAALIGANIVGSGAQFMAPGAALSRAAQVLGAGSKAARVASLVANPLGPGGAARTVAGRMLGNTALNTPLNLAVSQSPEDNTAGFVGEVTDSDALRNAARNPAAAFAIETAADLAGNVLFEGVGAGARRLTAEPAVSPGFIKAPERVAPRKPVDAMAPTRFVAPPSETLSAIEKEVGIEPAPAPTQAVAPPEPPVSRVKPEVPPTASIGEAVTGRPFRADMLRGEGGTRPQPRGDMSILGEGRYTTPDDKYALSFADDEAGNVIGSVAKHQVQLDNPLVIDSDEQWRALTKAAGWQFPNPGPPDLMDAAAVAAHRKAIAALRATIERAGHDGIVVRIPTVIEQGRRWVDERTGKLLDRVFGADQVVEFKAPQAEAPPARVPDEIDPDAAVERAAIEAEASDQATRRTNGRTADGLFDDIRTPGGSFRPIERVSNEGLLRQMVEYLDERLGTISGGRYGAKAVTDAMTRKLDAIEAELERRGMSQDDIWTTGIESVRARKAEMAAAAQADADASFFFASPRRPRGDDLSLFGKDTNADLFGGAPTMKESTVGQRAPKAPDVTGRAPETPGAISADELAARRDELGFEKSDAEGTATPDQGAMFSPAPERPRPKVTAEEMLAVGKRRLAELEQGLEPGAPPELGPALEREGRMFADLPSESLLSPAAAPAAASVPAPSPRLTPAPRAQIAGLTRELTTELASSAVGAAVGATAAPAEDREWGALFGAVGGFAGAKGALAFAKNRAALRALREDAKPLIKISRSLAAAVGVPLRQGRFLAAQRQALGAFFPHQEVTRLIRYDAVGTASHEVGHYISKKYLLNPTMKGAGGRGAAVVPTSVKRELIDAGKRLYGNRKPAGGYGEEGIAEFFKHYVIDAPALARDFPTATPWFRSLLEQEPALTAAMDQARTDFERYKASPANARIAAMLSVDERVRNMPTLTDYKRAAVDDLADIERAVKQLEGHGATPTARDAYTLARLTRGAAGAAEEMMEHGIEIGGKRVTDGLAPALRSIPEQDWQAFREYMVAERAVELAARGVDSGVDLASAKQTVARDAGRFADAARAVWAHSAALIDLRVEAGLLTPEEGKHIKSQNQKRVPFYREFGPEEQAGSSGGGGRQKIRNSSGIYRIKGSARKIIDPLESLVADTYKTVRQVREHAAAAALIKTALKTEGGGRIAELVPTPQTQTSFRIDRKTVEQMFDLGMIDEQTADEILSGMMTGDIAGRLSGFTDARMAGGAERKDMVMPVILEGERKWVQIGDADLFRTLQGMNQEELSSWQRALSWPTRTLRAGATLTLGFITRNPLRDLGTAFVRTRAGRWVAPGEHLVRGVFSLLKQDEMYQTWRLSGGDNATMLGLDRATTQKHLKDLRATAAEKGWNLVTKPIDTLRLLSSISENATRLGEFQLVYRRAIKAGKSVADARTLAAYAARDVSTDFAKAGTIGRQVNLIVEFVNATVQGDVNFFKDLRERPATVVPRAMALVTIPSVTLYLAQREDPVYQDVPQWAKDVGWVVVWPPLPVRRAMGMPDASASVAVIPKPFEWGVAFGTVPEKVTQYLGERDPHVMRQAADALVRSFAPNFIPTAIKPFVENFANESFFRRRPIVPRGKEGEDAWAQAGPRTGETARVIGRVADVSPAKIENVVTGYTGGLGKTALQGTDKIVRMAREVMGKEPLRPVMPSDREGVFGAPVLSAFLRPSPGMEAESIQRFYELSDRAERRRQTYKGLLDDGRTREAMAYFQQHKAEILAMGAATDVGTGPMRDIRQEITKLRELWGEVSRAPIAKAEKRRTISNIEQSIIALSRQGVAANRAAGTTPTRQARATR